MATLFGPDSAVWQLHGDYSGLIGGLRALVVQSLEPRALAGVQQFSQFQTDPDRRLRETIDFVDVVTYGQIEEVEAAIENVRRLHVPVRGVDPSSGESFSANDPFLLAWVHNAMVESVATTYSAFHPEVPLDVLDRYVLEMARFGELMGCDLGEIPGDFAQLNRWVWRQPLLVVNDATREAFAVLDQLQPEGFVGQAYPLVMCWIVGSLPEWVRTELGRRVSLPELTGVWLTLKVGGAAANCVTQPSPRRIRAQAQYAQEDANSA